MLRFSQFLVSACHGRKTVRLVSLRIIVLLAAVSPGGGLSITMGDDFSERDRFFSKLSAPMTSIVDGKPFRDALRDIADQAQLNLWIDRQVDPTEPLAIGPVGNTVYGAIEKLAAARKCAVMPVSGVLLVGRPEWVDTTTASLLSLGSTRRTGPTTEVIWEDLTTPSRALEIAAGGSVEITPPLPHDLWPATKWMQVERNVAVSLVLAQFDRKTQSKGSLPTLVSVEATHDGSYLRRYSFRRAGDAIRTGMKRADSKSRVRVSGEWLQATGSIAAHRAAVAAIFANTKRLAPPDPNKNTFKLKELTTTAGDALRQLSQVAKYQCVIMPEAEEACRKVITIEGQDATLRQLIDLVAKRAGVMATWKKETIVITLGE